MKAFKTVTVISFGPVKSLSNGYFIRVLNILKELSKINSLKLFVLEFPEYEVREKVEIIDGITFIRLRGNEFSGSKISRMLKKILTFDPLHTVRFQIVSFYELFKFRKLIMYSDVVMVEGCLIIAGLVLAKLLKRKVILDSHCINKLLAKKFKNMNTLVYLSRNIIWTLLERLAFGLSDVVIVVSTNEKDFTVREYAVNPKKIFVVPNVIELNDMHKLSNEVVDKLRERLGLKHKIVVTFIGDLNSVQNRDAVEYIINELAQYFLKKKHDVIFLIIGKGKENFNCNLPNVYFTGFVKELLPYMLISDVFIAPLRVGAGTKTKLFEYLTYSRPIVATPIAIEGFDDIIMRIPEIKKILHVVPIETFKSELLKVIEGISCFKAAEDYRKAIEKFENELMKQFRDSLYIVIQRVLQHSD